jgi:hypothetical protein
MELVTEFVRLQELNKPKFIDIDVLLSESDRPDLNGRVYSEESLRNSFRILDGTDIVMTFNGREVGTLQAITMDVERESASVRGIDSSVVVIDEFHARPYEGSVTLENTEINRNLLQELLYGEMTASYSYMNGQIPQSRAERRKKPSIKADEELHDGYRRGLRKMIGGRKKWN